MRVIFSRITFTAAVDLLDRLAADAQRHQEGADLRRRHLAGHNRAEGRFGLRPGSARLPWATRADQALKSTLDAPGSDGGAHQATLSIGDRCRNPAGSWRGSCGRARRRCSPDGTAPRRSAGSCAAGPEITPSSSLRGDRRARTGSVAGFDGQRVIARGVEIVRHVAEHALAAVVDRARACRASASARTTLAAEHLADRLVAEADAEDRHLAGRRAR